MPPRLCVRKSVHCRPTPRLRRREADVAHIAHGRAPATFVTDGFGRARVVVRKYTTPSNVCARVVGAVYMNGSKVRWKAVFSDSGAGEYESIPFAVPAKWRIRYRLAGGDGDSDATAELAWARDGDFFGFDDGSVVAESAGSMQVHRVDDGAGTYRLTVRPDADEVSWYVEVDALQ